MKVLLPSLVLLILTAWARADSPIPPYTRATTSGGGTAVFVMVPKLENGYFRPDQSSGTMYLVGDDGSLTKQWSVSGWFSHDVFLTNDGAYLVRFGPWNLGAHPRKEDLALSFYKAGKLLRSYSTAEMVSDPKAVRVTTGHYEWRSDEAPYIDRNEFWLTTIEGRFFVFDLESGAITTIREPAKEKTEPNHKAEPISPSRAGSP